MEANNIERRLTQLETQMKTALEGVANFRAHSKRADTFFDRYEEREEQRDRVDKRRSRIHFALLGGLITFIVGCAIALFTWILNGHHVVTVRAEPQTTADAGIPAYRQ